MAARVAVNGRASAEVEPVCGAVELDAHEGAVVAGHPRVDALAGVGAIAADHADTHEAVAEARAPAGLRSRERKALGERVGVGGREHPRADGDAGGRGRAHTDLVRALVPDSSDRAHGVYS